MTHASRELLALALSAAVLLAGVVTFAGCAYGPREWDDVKLLGRAAWDSIRHRDNIDRGVPADYVPFQNRRKVTPTK